MLAHSVLALRGFGAKDRSVYVHSNIFIGAGNKRAFVWNGADVFGWVSCVRNGEGVRSRGFCFFRLLWFLRPFFWF